MLDPQQTTQAANGLGNSTSQLPTPPNEGLLLATSQPKFQVSGDRFDCSAPVCFSLRKKLPRVRRAYSLTVIQVGARNWYAFPFQFSRNAAFSEHEFH